METTSMTTEGSSMTTESYMGEDTETGQRRMVPLGFQYPPADPMLQGPPSYYQQEPKPAVVSTSTAAPGDASMVQTSRKDSGSGEDDSPSTTVEEDKTKTTNKIQRVASPYGPWLPAFMCVLVVLLVLFLVPYIFLTGRGYGTPAPFGQAYPTTRKPKGERPWHPTTGGDRRRTPRQPLAGRIGGKCDSSVPCQGQAHCVRGVCMCDLAGTHVVRGVCVSARTSISTPTTGWFPFTTRASRKVTKRRIRTRPSRTPHPFFSDTSTLTPTTSIRKKVSRPPNTTFTDTSRNTTLTPTTRVGTMTSRTLHPMFPDTSRISTGTPTTRISTRTSQTRYPVFNDTSGISSMTPATRVNTGTTLPPFKRFTYVRTVRLPTKKDRGFTVLTKIIPKEYTGTRS